MGVVAHICVGSFFFSLLVRLHIVVTHSLRYLSKHFSILFQTSAGSALFIIIINLYSAHFLTPDLSPVYNLFF
jgi:hypothetical protein